MTADAVMRLIFFFFITVIFPAFRLLHSAFRLPGQDALKRIDNPRRREYTPPLPGSGPYRRSAPPGMSLCLVYKIRQQPCMPRPVLRPVFGRTGWKRAPFGGPLRPD